MSAVFISHSTSAPETETLAAIEVRDFSIQIIERLREELDKLNITYFFDKNEKSRNTWVPDDIEGALLDCQAAVIILSPAAFESAWVPFECGRLMARRNMEASFAVIPVLAGISMRELSGHAPLTVTGIDKLWKAEAASADLSSENIEEIVQQVLIRLAQESLDRPSLEQRWLKHVVDILKALVSEADLEDLESELTPDKTNARLAFCKYRHLAALFLMADFERFEDVFERLENMPRVDSKLRKELGQYLRSLWIPIDEAKKVVTYAEGEAKSALVRALTAQIPRDYVMRATADPLNPYVIPLAPISRTEASFHQAILDRFVRPERMEKKRSEKIYFTVDKSAVDDQILQWLHTQFPNAVVVIGNEEVPTEGISVTHQINPGLESERERYLIFIADRLIS